MRSSRFLSSSLAVLAVLAFAGCQLPLLTPGSAKGNLSLTFRLSQPGANGTNENNARLLLPTADRVSVTITQDSTPIEKVSLPIRSELVTFTASIEGRKPHHVLAEALSPGGTVLFRGETTITLFSDKSLSLYLLPLSADGKPWPTLAASEQPTSGAWPVQKTPERGASLSYLIDLGETASAFSFAPWPTTVPLYLQRLDGSVLETSEATIARSNLDTDTAFWVTYYQTGFAGDVGTIGAFTIPLQTLSLPAAYELGQGATVDWGSKLAKAPVNPTDGEVAWSLSSADLGTIDAKGVFTAGAPVGADSVPGTLTASSVSNPSISASVSLRVWGPSYSRLIGLKAEVDGVDQGLEFVQATTSYTLPKARGAASEQLLRLTPTAGATGQTLKWSADGATWNPMVSGEATMVTLTKGSYDIQVSVLAPNGVDASLYHVVIVKGQGPSSMSLTPTTLTLPTSTTNQRPFALAILPADLPLAEREITWSVDQPTLASIDAATGALTPKLPGVVIVTATSKLDPAVTATATLTLTASRYILKASDGGTWGDLGTKPVSAPVGTVSLAGSKTTLLALTATGTLKSFNAGTWSPLSLAVPLSTREIAMDDGGMLVAASSSRVYYLDGGVWSSSIPAPPVGIRSLAGVGGGIVIWGSDDNIWLFDGAFWSKYPAALPQGTTQLIMTQNSLVAAVNGFYREYSGGVWSSLGLPVLPQTVTSTFALNRLISLTVK